MTNPDDQNQHEFRLSPELRLWRVVRSRRQNQSPSLQNGHMSEVTQILHDLQNGEAGPVSKLT